MNIIILIIISIVIIITIMFIIMRRYHAAHDHLVFSTKCVARVKSQGWSDETKRRSCVRVTMRLKRERESARVTAGGRNNPLVHP
jgi:hypothetical protein